MFLVHVLTELCAEGFLSFSFFCIIVYGFYTLVCFVSAILSWKHKIIAIMSFSWYMSVKYETDKLYLYNTCHFEEVCVIHNSVQSTMLGAVLWSIIYQQEKFKLNQQIITITLLAFTNVPFHFFSWSFCPVNTSMALRCRTSQCL